MIGVLAVAAQCLAETTAGGVARFYDVGFRADLEFLGQGREERLDLYYPKNPVIEERCMRFFLGPPSSSSASRIAIRKASRCVMLRG